mmetsp:Transcript_28145/g.39635  ORF Transcript_28145/g.39635 Transcript_28145/m.39635 type:complete len:229 (-) Transcript_28145:1849-2535(-)
MLQFNKNLVRTPPQGRVKIQAGSYDILDFGVFAGLEKIIYFRRNEVFLVGPLLHFDPLAPRRLFDKQLNNYTTKSPDVRFFSHVPKLLQAFVRRAGPPDASPIHKPLLRSHVARSAKTLATCGEVVELSQFDSAKITYSSRHILAHQNIVRFQVAVNHFLGVQVAEAADSFKHDPLLVANAQALALDIHDIVQAANTELGNKVQPEQDAMRAKVGQLHIKRLVLIKWG